MKKVMEGERGRWMGEGDEEERKWEIIKEDIRDDGYLATEDCQRCLGIARL